MPKIVIISASVRIDRKSHNVALFFQKFLNEKNLAEVEMLDLKQCNFPIFDERLRFMKNPSADLIAFSEKIKTADGVLIVTPEYNGGYPASLKNAIDLLYDEWKRKPIALAAVSDGGFGGTQVITSLLFSLWKIGALVVPARFHASKVQENYAADGTPTDAAKSEKAALPFINELLHYIEKA